MSSSHLRESPSHLRESSSSLRESSSTASKYKIVPANGTANWAKKTFTAYSKSECDTT